MEYFVSRSPIFKGDQNILGYQLIFQKSVENALFEMSYLADTNKDDSPLSFSEVVAGKLSFINFSIDSIEALIPSCLDCNSTVVTHEAENLPTETLLIALLSLHDSNYKICLNNIQNEKAWEAIYPIVDFISFNIETMSTNNLFKIVDCIGRFPNIKLLATNVNDLALHELAVQMGFDYFEGMYFSQTEVLMSHSISPAETTLAELLYQTSSNIVDLNKIIEIIKRDVYLTYKVLGYANTVLFKRREQVSTIKQAVVTLGLVELKRFILIFFTTQLNKNRSKELVRLSLFRGKFCELIIEKSSKKTLHENESAEAFLVGLLSLIEAMFNESAESALKKLSLSENITNAIISNKGVLAQSLALAKISEQGNWHEALEQGKHLGLPKEQLIQINSNSLMWANQQMEMLNLET